MKKWLAEALGAFALVFAGTGAIIVNDVKPDSVTHVGVALTFGLIVMVMIYTVGDISGAHLNPAVSVAFCAAGRMQRGELAPYVLSQSLGACAASGMLRMLFISHPHLGATVPQGGAWQSFGLEFLLTWLLMLVILNVSRNGAGAGNLAAVAIGATVALEALFAGPVCGASMNPARSLGPALMSGEMRHLWIYLLAPTLGALAAVPTYCGLHAGESGDIN